MIKGSSQNTAQLFYRDPLKAIEYLLNRPSLIEHMEFAPYRLFTPSTLDPAGDEDEDEDEGEGEGETERLYTEMVTGNWWWHTQVSEAF
jgi:hypothetical protein